MHASETPGEGLKWAPLQLSATVVKGEAGARTITISYDLNRTAIRMGGHQGSLVEGATVGLNLCGCVRCACCSIWEAAQCDVPAQRRRRDPQVRGTATRRAVQNAGQGPVEGWCFFFAKAGGALD